jgi:hypothetical protein
MYMPIAIIVAIVLMIGAMMGARAALPGDTLYPVKVNVNERFGTWMSIGDESNARSRIAAIDHRLDETERLIDQRKLTAAVRTILENMVSQEVVSIKSYTAALENRGNSEDAVRVESELKLRLKERMKPLRVLNVRFNPDNLDSFMRGGQFAEAIDATNTATTTLIKLSKPVIEGPGTTTNEGGPR